jgi:hypothetical protein
MASLLSVPVVGNPEQARLQVLSRLDGIFGRRRVGVELVHSPTGVLTEIIVALSDDLPEEDVRAFRRALDHIDGRLGVAIAVPVGSGGGVASTKVSNFDSQGAGAPVGFTTVGNVTVGGGGAIATGPNLLHTDPGGGSSGPNLLHTDGGGAATHDLSTTPVTAALPILPGSLTLSGTIGASGEVATDNGAGAFPVSTLLPAGGTINYATGAMTGTTAALDASSTITESHTLDGVAVDLSTIPVTAVLPIQPGSLSISLDIGTAETITDDGLGALTGTTGSLPGGGTINYDTGAMTGTTDALAASTTIVESHLSGGTPALSPAQSATLDSGAAAGDAALICAARKAIGQLPAEMNWSFNTLFASNFALNNNAVAGAKAITLEARLLGAAAGRDIILQWTSLTDDTTPPTDWGTPTFTNAAPGTSPTAALAIDMDGAWHEIVIRRASANVLGVAYDGVEELFTFTEELVVPSKVLVNHNWGDALDRSFNVDDWTFSFSLVPPA